VCALAREERRAALEALFFRHSPTLGVRSSAWQRVEARREELAIELEGRCVRVKVRRVAGQPALLSDVSPEYDDLAELARATGRPLRELALLAQRAAFEALGR